MLQEPPGHKPGCPADSSHRRGFLSCVRGFICKHFDVIIPAEVRENTSFSISHWQQQLTGWHCSRACQFHAQHTPGFWSCSNTQVDPDGTHWCNCQRCNSIQHTLSENRYRHQLNSRFFPSSCQFHFTDSRVGFPHPLVSVFRPPFQILFITGILFQPVALTTHSIVTTHHTWARLHYRVNDICWSSYRTSETWVTATPSIGDISTFFAVSN